MLVSEAVDSRRSVRAFLEKDVPISAIEQILSKATRTPSGINSQPWNVYVLTGQKRAAVCAAAKRAALSNPNGEAPPFDIYPDPMPKDVQLRYFQLGTQMFGAMGIGRDDKVARQEAVLKNFDFYGAPAGLIVTLRKDLSGPNQWAYVGMFMQTFALLAAEAGLGTCMQEAWAQYHKTVTDEVGIPDTQFVYCGIALGYADPSARINTLRTDRQPLSEFATFLA